MTLPPFIVWINATTRRPLHAVRIFVNGREQLDVVTAFALWNGGPGFARKLYRLHGRFIVDDLCHSLVDVIIIGWRVRVDSAE